MKKIVSAALVLTLLTALTGASASPGGSSDPLVTLSYAQGAYKDALVEELVSAAEERLQEVYDRAAASLGQTAPDARYTDGRQGFTLSGGTLTVPAGGCVTVVSGDVAAAVNSGEMIDASQGSAASGSTLLLNRRYIVAEGSVTLTAAGSAQLFLEGPYVPGSGVLTPMDGSAPDKPQQPQVVFTDVSPNGWAAEAVSYMASHNLMNGTSTTNKTFSPAETTTRGMVVTILARADGVDTTGSSPWYQRGVEWAVSAGVSDGTKPTATISRQEIATMLWRYYGQPACDQAPGMPDDSAVASWAFTAVSWCVKNGIITGNGQGLINPNGSARRDEVAAMIYRALTKLG